MTDKTSFYHFSTMDEKPYVALCKDLFESLEEADVIFVTKDKEVKAHKLVLSLSSSFFSNLFEDSRLDYKVLLPGFSSDVISAFLQFFYTGELLIDDVLIGDLACLCHEFNCEEIPVLSELIEKHRTTSNRKSDGIIGCLTGERKNEMDFDESQFFGNDTVETIFFNENEGEFLEASELERKPDAKLQGSTTEVAEVKEEYENVQYIEDDNPNFELVEENEKNKQEMEAEETKPEDDPHLYENLQLAAEDVRGGMSFWNAHKKYDLSKSENRTRNMILRHLQKESEQRKKLKAQTKPSITFPALPMNINQLREEQNRFKKRLQEAINACRDSGHSTKKAAKMFGVPVEAIERNLRGFKKSNP